MIEDQHSSPETQGPEEWRAIPGYEDVYQASSLGRIRRIRPYHNTKPGGILKPHRVGAGYVNVGLSKNNVVKQCYIHRLVAAAFLGPRTTDHQVNHINGIKTDNSIRNLEYVTKAENLRHSREVLGNNIGERHPRAQLTTAQVAKIRELYATGEYSQAALGRQYRVSDSVIYRIVHRYTWR